MITSLLLHSCVSTSSTGVRTCVICHNSTVNIYRTCGFVHEKFNVSTVVDVLVVEHCIMQEVFMIHRMYYNGSMSGVHNICVNCPVIVTSLQ